MAVLPVWALRDPLDALSIPLPTLGAVHDDHAHRVEGGAEGVRHLEVPCLSRLVPAEEQLLHVVGVYAAQVFFTTDELDKATSVT